MQLDAYLARIGFDGDIRPDLPTLTALLRAHVCAVPFENFDVQLCTPLSTSIPAAYEKIVERKRGGWCYEQNGLFGWALGQAGFEVTRVAAAVMRHVRGDASLANHLCLVVGVANEKTLYLADVGFGGSLVAPLPLEASSVFQAPFNVGLVRLDDGGWRFSEQAHGDPFEYDFEASAGDEAAMAAKCIELQTNPDSGFVLNAVVQRRTPDRHYKMRGRVLTTTTASGTQEALVHSAEEYVTTLRELFSLELPEAGTLWPLILARHSALDLPTPG